MAKRSSERTAVFQLRLRAKLLKKWRRQAESLGVTLAGAVVLAMEILEQSMGTIFWEHLEVDAHDLLCRKVRRTGPLDLDDTDQVARWMRSVAWTDKELEPYLRTKSVPSLPRCLPMSKQGWRRCTDRASPLTDTIDSGDSKMVALLRKKCLMAVCDLKVGYMEELVHRRQEYKFLITCGLGSKEELAACGPDAARLGELVERLWPHKINTRGLKKIPEIVSPDGGLKAVYDLHYPRMKAEDVHALRHSAKFRRQRGGFNPFDPPPKEKG